MLKRRLRSAILRTFYRRDYTSVECYECHGTGRIPHRCDCCNTPLPHVDALCITCANKGCYIDESDKHRFSDTQIARYYRWRDKQQKRERR